MKSRRVFSPAIFLFCLFLITTVFSRNLFSQDNSLLPQDESAGTFYEAALDSEDVRLFLSGSWKISLSAAGGFGWSEASGFSSELFYPGIAQGVAFSQSPDLTVSLLILNHFFFDSSFTDNFDESTFRLGYLGGPGDFIQSVTLGNMDISLSDRVSDSRYFNVPGGGPASFGLHSVLQGPFSEHELLLRVDPHEELKKIYVGGDLVIETAAEISDYLRGRVFLVPGTPSGITVYAETAAGSDGNIIQDGRSFYPLDDACYSYSPQSGRLVLDSSPEGAVIVETPDASRIMIYDPGVFLSYESAAAYGIDTAIPAESWRTRVFLAESVETASAGIELKKEILTDEGMIILKQAAGGSELYPLSGLLSNPSLVYGETALSEAGAVEKKLVFRIRQDANGYTVDNPVEGSIRITVNGINRYDWNLTGGTISFVNPPGEQDRVEIQYRRKNSGLGTDVLLASANRFAVNDNWSADINAGGRLNIAESYSVPGEETSSYAEGEAGIFFDSGNADDSPLNISAGLRAGARLYTGNSSGRLLLKNMSATSFDVSLNRNRVFPSSKSKRLESDLGLNQADRGILLYKDYRIPTGFSGYYLQDYNISNLSADMVYSPADSVSANMLKAGPYTASALSDGRSGEILAMDYILPAADGWSGIQIPLSDGLGNPDLSGSSAFSFDCKAEGDLSGIDLYIEIGSLDEDLDGDGILDAESSEYSTGFVFNDPNAPGGTLIGGDNLSGENGIRDSEDFNGNGFLDTEKSEAVVFQKLNVNPTADWMRYRIYLTRAAGDTAKSRLRNAGFIRITAVNTSTGEKTGRILFDDFLFEGSPMTVSDEAGFTSPSFSQTWENLLPSSETADSALDSPTIDAGNGNQLLKINWDSGNWKLFSYLDAPDTSDYGNIVFYYFCPSVTASGADPPLLHFSLSDSAGLGKKAALPLDSGSSWHRAELRSDGVYVDGVPASGAVLTDDADAGTLNKIEIYTSGTTAGTLLIDEIYLADPYLNMTAGISADFNIEYTKNLLEAGGIPIIGTVDFTQTASAESYADNLNSSGTGVIDSFNDRAFSFTTNLKTSVLGAPLSADLMISDTSPLALSAGHNLQIPLSFAGLTLSDSFFSEELSVGNFSKNNSLQLSTPVFSGTLIGFNAIEENNQLIRRWKSDMQLSLGIFSLGCNTGFLLSDLGHSMYASDYFLKWYEATALAVNEDYAVLNNRSISLGLEPSLAAVPAGIKAELTFSSDVVPDNESTAGLYIGLGVPLVFGKDNDAVKTEITYKRNGTFSAIDGSRNFLADISDGLSVLIARSYLFDSAPYYELFDPGLGQRLFDDCSASEIDSAVLENTAGFSLSRNYTSSLFDILLPYSLELDLGRKIVKDYTDLEDGRTLDIIYRSAAINLFGAAGAYPVFDFYFSDEINWAVEAVINNPFTEDASSEILLKSGGSVFGHEEDIFSLDTTTFFPVDTDSGAYTNSELTYVWNIRPEIKTDLPVFTDEDEAMQIFVNEEKLTLNFSDTFSTELRHSTSFVIPGRFTLSAFALGGFEYNALSENKAALFGYSFGISGSVIY